MPSNILDSANDGDGVRLSLGLALSRTAADDSWCRSHGTCARSLFVLVRRLRRLGEEPSYRSSGERRLCAVFCPTDQSFQLLVDEASTTGSATFGQVSREG